MKERRRRERDERGVGHTEDSNWVDKEQGLGLGGGGGA